MTTSTALLRNAPDLAELDRRYLFHPFTALADHERNGPMVITEGKGVWLKDDKGDSYIDSMAGLWCVNAGHGRAEIADAIADHPERSLIIRQVEYGVAVRMACLDLLISGG